MRRVTLLFLLSCVCCPLQGQWIGSSTTEPIYRQGNVGIGASPTDKFSIFLDESAPTYLSAQFVIHGQTQTGRVLAIGYDTSGNSGFIQAAENLVGFTPLLLQPQGGGIGIGGRPPSAERLTIFGDATSTSYLSAQFAIHGVNNPPARLAIGYDTVDNRGFIQAAEQGVAYRDLILQPDAGDVIIGSAPQSGERLRVNGDVFVSGNIGAKYQDLAEWVPASEDLAPGTVVVLNPAQSNVVMRSDRPYDTSVAGVVSDSPGIVLGASSPGAAKVSTTGRVRVMVDASHSSIHIGDLLVTSDVRGAAMKSEPAHVAGITMHRPGTILGKALEPLEHGRGQILVLLSLQ